MTIVNNILENLVSDLSKRQAVLRSDRNIYTHYLKDVDSATLIDVSYPHILRGLERQATLVDIVATIGRRLRQILSLPNDTVSDAQVGWFICIAYIECNILTFRLKYTYKNGKKSRYKAYFLQVKDWKAIEQLWSLIDQSKVDIFPLKEQTKPWSSAFNVNGAPIIKKGHSSALAKFKDPDKQILFDTLNKLQSTGWRINNTTTIPTAFFDSTKHHTSNKQFSAFYGNAVIPYQSGANGALETDILIDMLFSKQQEVAKFMCRKLYRFFIYYTIDNTVETNVIAPLAQIFINNNWDIVPVLKTLFKSEHFFELNSKGCIIKSPIDFLVGIFNTFKVDVPATMTDYNKALIYNYVRSYGSLIAQDIADPPNVSGWPSYYQVPEFHEIWINSNTLPRRMVFSDMMLNSGFTAGSGTTIKIDYLNFVAQIPNADDPVILIDYLCNLLLGISVSQSKKDALRINYLLSGQTSNYYWTNAWITYIGNPNTANTNIVKPRLLGLFLELTRLPEFQLS